MASESNSELTVEDVVAMCHNPFGCEADQFAVVIVDGVSLVLYHKKTGNGLTELRVPASIVVVETIRGSKLEPNDKDVKGWRTQETVEETVFTNPDEGFVLSTASRDEVEKAHNALTSLAT